VSYQVVWTNHAKADLRYLIARIIKDGRPLVARKIYGTIRARCRLLTDQPKLGRIIPELLFKDVKNYRELLYSSWRIFYRITGTKVRIIAIMDSRRDAASYLRQRGLDQDD